MNAAHEIIEYNEELPIKLFYQRIGSVSKHWHRSLELLFVLKGQLQVTVGNRFYLLEEDDILVINPNTLHETFSEDCVLLSLQMRLSMFRLSWLSPDSISFECNSAESTDKSQYDKIKRILAHMLQSNMEEAVRNSLTNYTYAYQLMDELVRNYRAEESEETLLSQKALIRLRSITDYLEAHYPEDITLTGMAEHEYMSPSYLSHFFEKYMGTTFSSYLSKLRLEHSLEDLYEDISIEEIAERNGFPSSRSYASSFRKRYGILPSEYRKTRLNRATPPSALVKSSSSSYLALERINYFEKLAPYLKTSAAEMPTTQYQNKAFDIGEISADSSLACLRHTCRVFCSVGRARELLDSRVQQMLRIQQSEMPFQYIKFHGIFDDALYVYQEDEFGKPILNFFYIDQVLDFLKELRLKPLLQLSFMPEAMAKHPERKIFYAPFMISEPKADSAWSYLVTEFTRHLIERYGYEDVRSWRFTFWNEALNSSLPFCFDTPETAFRLYEISYQAVKQLIPEAHFASMSYVTYEFDEKLFHRYLNYMQTHQCMADSLLFHYYSKLSSGTDSFTDYTRLFLSYSELTNRPVYLTEWNFTSSHREWLNDTCYTSCYIVRTVLQHYDLLESFCHWSLTDLHWELPPAQETFHGGMGFFTRDGMKKPAYYAYYFLSRLEDILVHQEEGCYMTRNEEGTRFSLLLYHYQHYSSSYAEGINFTASFSERYLAFPSASAVSMSFSFLDIKDGSYLMTEQYVNRNSGSVFDQWLRMGGVELRTKEELDTLSSLSVPMLIRSQPEVSGGRLDYHTVLEPHEIRLIRLELLPNNRFKTNP